MDAAIKELDRLQNLTSFDPGPSSLSSTSPFTAQKGKQTIGVAEALDGLLAALRDVKERVESGTASEHDVANIAKIVEERKKEIDDRQKEIHATIGRIGKALDKKFTNPVPEIEPLFTSNEAQDALQRTIALHFLRTGQFETAEVFINESDVTIPPENTVQFIELHSVLTALRRQDIGLALEWCKRNEGFLKDRNSPLEFYLHRSQFMRLLLASNPPDPLPAIVYSRTFSKHFYSTYGNEIGRLLTCCAFLPIEKLLNSPCADLASPSVHLDLEPMFAKEYCASLGMSRQVPLRVVGDIGGGGALARIEKGRKVMRERKSEWSQTNELPIEIPLPPENRYHSIFACPVSKEQSTPANPPMMISCGHVIAKDSLAKLAKPHGKAKCPYCPQEFQQSQALEEFDDDGKPLKPFGCPRGRSCKFVHPDNSYWATAPRCNRVPSNLRAFPLPSGRGRGRGGPPTGLRERTGSNVLPLGSANGNSGWGSKKTTTNVTTTWGANWSTSTDKGKDKDKKEGTSGLSKGWDSGWDSGWGSGWGSAGDSKNEDTGKDKGKEKAVEPPSGGWAEMTTENDNVPWSGWGATAEWTATSPVDTKSGSSTLVQTNEPGSSKRSTVSPVSEKRHMSETKIWNDEKKKDSRSQSLGFSSAEPPSKVDVDSPRSSIAPSSVTSWRDTKPFASPIHNRSASALIQPFTADDSAHSSRAGSVVPFSAVPPPKEARTLRSVSYKDARDVWNEYIDLIRRPIALKLFLIQERARHKDYKAAQNSPTYTRVGRQGTILLDENMRKIKTRVERDEKAYKAAVDNLCAFEEGFDFAMNALTGPSIDTTEMKNELTGLKSYVDEAKTCVDAMQATGSDIETKARVVTEPVASPTPVVKEEKEEPEKVESATPINQDQEINGRLQGLRDKSMGLFSTFLDERSNSEANDAIRGKVDELKMSLLESLRTEEEELSARVTKLSEDHASLGRDLEELCDDVAGLLTSLGQVELTMQQEIDRLRESLEEDQRLLEASEARARECHKSLEKSNGNLASLRQGLRTLEESQRRDSEPPLDQVIASLLPIIRTQLYPEIELALELMTSRTVEVVREHNENQLHVLFRMLEPLCKMTGDLHSGFEIRSPNPIKGPLPVSLKVGELGAESLPLSSNI
ncbi:hypothetical protein ACEPAI_5325 [Sanghuangporus weigelae]